MDGQSRTDLDRTRTDRGQKVPEIDFQFPITALASNEIKTCVRDEHQPNLRINGFQGIGECLFFRQQRRARLLDVRHFLGQFLDILLNFLGQSKLMSGCQGQRFVLRRCS